MANVKQGNFWYVDATGSLTADGGKLIGVILTSTGAGAVLELRDSAGTNKRLSLKLAADGESKYFDFINSPLSFPLGIKVQTLTNAICTVIYTS